jgi:hypothetical protein
VQGRWDTPRSKIERARAEVTRLEGELAALRRRFKKEIEPNLEREGRQAKYQPSG